MTVHMSLQVTRHTQLLPPPPQLLLILLGEIICLSSIEVVCQDME